MRRNLNEIRRILIAIADSPNQRIEYEQLADKCKPSSKDDLNYQLSQMVDGKLVKKTVFEDDTDSQTTGYSHCTVTVVNPKITAYYGPLTYKGGELLADIRNDRVWEKVQQKLADTVGTASIDVIQLLARHIALTEMGV